MYKFSLRRIIGHYVLPEYDPDVEYNTSFEARNAMMALFPTPFWYIGSSYKMNTVDGMFQYTDENYHFTIKIINGKDAWAGMVYRIPMVITTEGSIPSTDPRY